MSDPVSSPTPDPERDERMGDALAYLCEHLDEVRGKLSRGRPTYEDGQEPALLQTIVHGLQADEQPSDLAAALEELHTALRWAGDALGLWGHLPGHIHGRDVRGDVILAGIARESAEILYLCPVGRCSGRRPEFGTVFPLTCSVVGAPLRRERL